MAPPVKIKWGLIDRYWRGTVVSVRGIALIYKELTGIRISHAAISHHYKRQGIKKGDLLPMVRAKANAMVLEAMAKGEGLD